MERYEFGTGRRKTAVAQARIYSGKGEFVFSNGKKIIDKFLIEEISKPLTLVGQLEKVKVSISLSGGGIMSQAEAARLAVSRALIKQNEEFEKTLKKDGLLTRDPREKERKKPGLKRARKAPQWAKR